MPTSAIHAEARLGGVSRPGGDGQGPMPECSLYESLATPQQPQESILTLFDDLLTWISSFGGEKFKNRPLTCVFFWRTAGLM
jgi:hypothetical protein